MAFVKKNWQARISEYPNRRTITDENGVAKLVTVGRSEGAVSQEGDSFTAANMNDLEQRIYNGFQSGGGGGGGGGGHTIIDDSGTSLEQQPGLQFKGAYSADNSTDNITEVNIVRSMTKAQFNQLSAEEKVGIINITDESGVPWTDITGTLTAGQTSITLSDSSITTSSTIEVFDDLDVPYNSKTLSTGSITLTFDAQESNMSVQVRVS